MTLFLFLHRIVVPIWLSIALIVMVGGHVLNGLIIVGVWLLIHFVLCNLVEQEKVKLRQQEQARLAVLRELREMEQRWEEPGSSV